MLKGPRQPQLPSGKDRWFPKLGTPFGESLQRGSSHIVVYFGAPYLRKAPPVDGALHCLDCWSLGAVVYFITERSPPFTFQIGQELLLVDNIRHVRYEARYAPSWAQIRTPTAPSGKVSMRGAAWPGGTARPTPGAAPAHSH